MPIEAITPIWYMVVEPYGRSDRTGNVLVAVWSVQRSSEGRQKRDGVVL